MEEARVVRALQPAEVLRVVGAAVQGAILARVEREAFLAQPLVALGPVAGAAVGLVGVLLILGVVAAV
jgi:hypothetical protein